GTLIHPLTVINFSTNTLQYTDVATLHYQRGPNGGVWQSALGDNNKDGQASFSDNVLATNTGGIVVGRQLQVTPTSPGVATSELRGDQVLVVGTSTAGGGISGSVTGINVITNNLASPSGNNVAIAAWAQGASSSSAGAINVGLKTLISGTNSQRNYGVYSIIQGAPAANEDMGVNVFSMSNASSTTNIGGNFNVSNGQNVYGLKVSAQSGTAINYGIYVTAVPSSSSIPNYGIYSQAPILGSYSTTVSYAGYFAGNVVKTGSDNFSSDQNLKQNLDSIPNAIGIIKQLKPKTFDFKQSSYPSMNLPSGKQYGLIAQDVQPILPELVNTITHPAKLDSLGNIVTPSFTYLALEYQQLTPIIIRAMQQQERRAEKQDSTIQAMQSQIAALTSSVTSCCSSSLVRTTKPSELNQLDINLSDKDIVVLNQNVPNPFAEQTTITYNVPEKYNFAQIIFSTVEGKIIKAVDITKKGKGQLNVFANDLGTGFYTYTLIVDGKTIDTKKMVKSE
ncbi:MAG TPA: tail fiber domain-containing protein, partial [Bacteroidia bacterium]|nr:tail fiber domain-containing protein [Bacteroidia bacterium]